MKYTQGCIFRTQVVCLECTTEWEAMQCESSFKTYESFSFCIFVHSERPRNPDAIHPSYINLTATQQVCRNMILSINPM